jgi:hypothetical protein
MKPEFITFTGVDAQTDSKRLRDISSRYPCEWGVLFSPNRQGKDQRYPSYDIISNIISFMEDNPFVSFAAHVCGQYAESLMTRVPISIGYTYLPYFGRIQVNHVTPDVSIMNGFSDHIKKPVIIQTRQTDVFPPTMQGVHWLYDASGGKGILPTTYPENSRANLVGYAGGINPENVVVVNDMVQHNTPYWLDMETGVRTDNWLDLDKVEMVLEKIYG